MLCNSLIVSADVQFALPDDQLYSGTYDNFVILSRRHTQAVIDEAEDIGWNAINCDWRSLMFSISSSSSFVPVITEADIDAYLACDSKPTSYGDPRNGFTEFDLPYVLTFLGWVAQFKAMNAPQSDPGHFGYETMLYAYHDVAEAI